jgi:hypothetical protein
MRKRARKIAIGLGLLVAALVAGLVAMEPEALATRVIVWRARMRGAAVVWPRPKASHRERMDIQGSMALEDLLQVVADSSGRPIVVEGCDRECIRREVIISVHNLEPSMVLSLLKGYNLELSRESAGRVWSLHFIDYGLIDLNL